MCRAVRPHGSMCASKYQTRNIKIMTRKFFSALSILSALGLYAQSSALPADTLLNAKVAQNISIVSTPRSTSITVNNLENGPDSFFYQTGTQARNIGSNSRTQINCPDISNVVVCESDSNVAVNYINSVGETHSYTFAFADPDNRTLKSYIGYKGSDFGFTISRSHSTKWEAVSSGLGFGWCTPTDAPAGIDGNMWHSNEIFWNMILGVRMTHRAQTLSMGFGIHWQGINTRGTNYFHKSSDGVISLVPYSEEQTKGSSSLKFFSLQMPLLYGLNFGHNRCCNFSLGRF